MRGAEAVKEADKGDPAAEGGEVGNRRQIHDLLYSGTCPDGSAGLAAGIDVGVIAEDGESVGRQRTGCNVKNTRQQFSRHTVEVGDHEEQSL